MFLENKERAPRREREGLISQILLQKGDVPGDRLAVTWVDVAPGAGQRPHSHPAEQVYVIVRGRGRIEVGNEKQEVAAGDLIYIPSNAIHSIRNRSDETLSYISAATPAVDMTALYDKGDLQVENHPK